MALPFQAPSLASPAHQRPNRHVRTRRPTILTGESCVQIHFGKRKHQPIDLARTPLGGSPEKELVQQASNFNQSIFELLVRARVWLLPRSNPALVSCRKEPCWGKR